ncbi:hypothetical protein PR202_ga31034 [Eleusine coracana subsp. coracana]|uniref:Uncharacterized protein n=1 Tax=Eleusine coracana subsp. coracana TaxID=191504 RepID=A0AAV5DQW9_ELECO|nr:hypothetical protein PR202_ga31034 [Eleusine coracana subsp. coracana]
MSTKQQQQASFAIPSPKTQNPNQPPSARLRLRSPPPGAASHPPATMMQWWWTGVYGAIKRKKLERAVAAAPMFNNVALVVGSTGIVGAALVDILPSPDTPAGPWKVYTLSHRPLPPWSAAAPSPAVAHLHLDLSC